MRKDNQEIGLYVYNVKAKYRDFVIAKKVKSENQYTAVVDFLQDLSLLAAYHLGDNVFILSVEQFDLREEE